MKIFFLAILWNLPVLGGFTRNLAFFGHICMVSLDVILILSSRKVLFRCMINIVGSNSSNKSKFDPILVKRHSSRCCVFFDNIESTYDIILHHHYKPFFLVDYQILLERSRISSVTTPGQIYCVWRRTFPNESWVCVMPNEESLKVLSSSSTWWTSSSSS